MRIIRQSFSREFQRMKFRNPFKRDITVLSQEERKAIPLNQEDSKFAKWIESLRNAPSNVGSTKSPKGRHRK